MKFPPALLFLTALVGQVTNAVGQAPSNDLCSGAISVSLDTPASGSTLAAQPEDSSFEFCGPSYRDAPGVWYEIEGTGNRFSADTCRSDYDTKLHVYHGASCETLTCIDGDDDYYDDDDGGICGYETSQVVFETAQGQTYHILVHGGSEDDTGNYQLVVHELIPPPNDECPGAMSVSLDTPVSGSTLPAQPDGTFDFCGPSYRDAPGVWYEIIGNGNQLEANTCGSAYDTKLHVFHGASCETLTCIDGAENDSSCGPESRVVFNTVQGQTYHILVHGDRDDDSGAYPLTVTEWLPPPNDECPGAISVSLDTPVSGNTNTAEADANFEFCGTSYRDAPGVWYEIVGNGNKFAADTCGSAYDTKLHVYQGASCGALTCIDGDNDSSCGPESRVLFDTVQGETYHILVHGDRWHDSGYYQLTVTDFPPPPNDECPGAISVSLDTPVSGNTLPAQADGTFDFCGTDNWGNAAPGVWYQIIGNGNRFSADTCRSAYATKLHVYHGASCNDLACIDGDDGNASCGWGSRVDFDTQQGETYHILVHGYWEEAVGPYQLTVTELIPPPNDECPGAISVSLDTPVSGSTLPAQPDGTFDFCETSNWSNAAPGVWYEIEGNGNRFSADTCGSAYETKLHVYHGASYNDLACIDGDDGNTSCGWGSRVDFYTQQGETYHILVHGYWEAAVGPYQLTVTELIPPPNDECPGAISVSLDTPVSGNTLPAQADGTFDFCGTTNYYDAAPGVWYQIVGNRNRFSADTCGSAYETKLHVYHGASCNDLACIDGDDGNASCGWRDSRVDFDTQQGEIYHILVHGYREEAFGAYQLTVIELVTPPNDECPGAISVSLDTPISGNTLPAQPDGTFDFCGPSYRDAPGVWYEIEGTGNRFSADTCGSAYNAKLHVFHGASCNDLTCIDGDDGGAPCESGTSNSRVFFDTIQGETYHMLVHGAYQSQSGRYGLTVTELPPRPNDECSDATSLSLNTPVSGNTASARPDDTFDFCGYRVDFEGAPGTWYKIVGNGNAFTATTCGSEYDTQLHVYQGDSCDDLICINGNNDYYDGDDGICDSENSRVVFETVQGQTYHILVHGDDDDEFGNYQLTVSGAERTESGGDPHFTTWKQEHYEYHGQCDLVMLKDENFADGLGLHIHIRTKLVRYWSYIKSVAIKIGNDILEIEGSASADDDQAHYWMNYEYQGELESIAGFPVTQKLPSTYKRSYTIDLSSKYPGQDITVQLYKEFVRVKINGQEMAFGNSVGLMGDYKTGKTLARDGVTVLDDFTELGDEWQVLPSDARLFREASHPQFPELCIKPEDPRGERQRRLAESEITVEQAESACGSLKDVLAMKDCVYDILATQDLDMVGAF